ncbi:site-specific recombinase XerD [Flavobacteriaceae bacterium MAR_2009_75]|nr:site-specific recombinase XerD [Flavobacteriaceae bacterium MAR_2009_75]
MATINFLYRSTRPEAFLNLRLLYRAQDKTLPKGYKDFTIGAKTKTKVSSKYWNNQHNRRSKDIDIINLQREIKSELSSLESFVLTEFEKAQKIAVGKKWLQNTVDKFYQPNQSIQKIPQDLIGFFDYYIAEREREISVTSKRKLNVVKHKMERLESYLGSTIMIREIGDSFKKEFVDYYESQGYSKATTQRELGYIKTLCKFAKVKGLDTHNELINLKLKKESIRGPYLSFEELDKIKNAPLEHEYQENARDWLLISCYTGQRVSDFLRFTSEMLREEKGKLLLEFKQKKTQKLMTIPVLPEVKEVLEKREGNFPRPLSDQRYNEYIKEVCQEAKLFKKIKGKKKVNLDPESKKGKFRAIEGMFPKWELVSSHIGRRSFCTNYYGIIPTNFLMYISGHSTESIFLDYIGKSNKDLALEIADLFEVL